MSSFREGLQLVTILLSQIFLSDGMNSSSGGSDEHVTKIGKLLFIELPLRRLVKFKFWNALAILFIAEVKYF